MHTKHSVGIGTNRKNDNSSGIDSKDNTRTTTLNLQYIQTDKSMEHKHPATPKHLFFEKSSPEKKIIKDIYYDFCHPGTYTRLPFEKKKVYMWSCCANYFLDSKVIN